MNARCNVASDNAFVIAAVQINSDLLRLAAYERSAEQSPPGTPGIVCLVGHDVHAFVVYSRHFDELRLVTQMNIHIVGDYFIVRVDCVHECVSSGLECCGQPFAAKMEIVRRKCTNSPIDHVV